MMNTRELAYLSIRELLELLENDETETEIKEEIEEMICTCDRCGGTTLREDLHEVNGQNYCENCYDNFTTTCSECGEVFDIDDIFVSNYDLSLCQSCFEDYYYHCDRCGDLIRRSEAYGYGGGTFCEYCYDLEREEECSEHIYSYHSFSRSNILFNGEDPFPNVETVYTGVELEIDRSCNISECAEELYNISNDERLFHLEEDGSLSEGFEIITQPFENHDNFPWEEICEISKKYGFKSHDTSSCGLHIHFSKSPFIINGTADEIESKMLYYISCHEQELSKFSRRNYNGYCNIKKLPKQNTISEVMNTVREEKRYSNRYEVLNLTGANTWELRCFKGTLKPETIRATIEFVKLFLQFCIVSTLEELETTSLMELIEKMEGSENIKNYYAGRLNNNHTSN